MPEKATHSKEPFWHCGKLLKGQRNGGYNYLRHHFSKRRFYTPSAAERFGAGAIPATHPLQRLSG